MSDSDWARVLAGANACQEHYTGIEESDVEQSIAAVYNDGDWSESDGVALVELKNGQYAVIEQWEDTTGHG